MQKVDNNFYDKELESLQPSKKAKVFVIAFVISLLLFSYVGYLILTEEPPQSERDFFDSIGLELER